MSFGYITAIHGLFHIWPKIFLNLYITQVKAARCLAVLPLPGLAGINLIFIIRYTSFVWSFSISDYETHLSERMLFMKKNIHLSKDIPKPFMIQFYFVKLESEKKELPYMEALNLIQDEITHIILLDDIRGVNLTPMKHMIHFPRMEGIAGTLSMVIP